MKRLIFILLVMFSVPVVPAAAQEPDPVAIAQQQADRAEAAARSAQARASQAQAEASAAQARANQAAAQASSAAREAEQARLNATLAEAQAAIDKAAEAQRLYEQALSESTAAVERANVALAESGAALQAYEQARRNADGAVASAQERTMAAQERATAAEGNLNTMSAVLDGEREQVEWLRLALVFVAALGVAGLAFIGLLYTRQLKPVTVVEHHYDRAEQAGPEPARRALGVTIVGGSAAREAIDHLDTIVAGES